MIGHHVHLDTISGGSALEPYIHFQFAAYWTSNNLNVF